MWSLVGALDEALERDDRHLINKLWEVSINVTVRIRLHPSKAQVQLDQLSFIDVLRTQAIAAGADSFFEFAWAILEFDVIKGDESGPDLVKKLDFLGVTFAGQKVTRACAYSILSIVGLADEPLAKAAVRFVERISFKIFADPTKVQSVFQVLKKSVTPPEWKDAIVFLLEQIGVALMSGDVLEGECTVDFLVPKTRNHVGHVAATVTKRRFLKWFIDEQMMTAASGASNALSTQGLAATKSKCCSPRDFWHDFYDGSITEDR